MRIVTGLIFLMLLILLSCVEVFNPRVSDGSGQLVIYGLMTDQDERQYVYLSRTQAVNDLTAPDRISGADVKIVDNEGLVFSLNEESPGIYATPGIVQGVVGRLYHVEVNFDEQHYESEPELMEEGSDIVDIHASFEESVEIPGTSEVEEFVVAFRADIKNTGSNFYKYDWDAVYTIEVPFREDMDACRGATDGSPLIPICYVSETSEKFLNILSLEDYGGPLFPKHLITTVYPNIRFMLRFSLNVKQYSLTPRAYKFWEDVRTLTESSGSLFDPPPTRIIGNLRSISNPREVVLGYFMASAVAQRREFFSSELITVDLQHFNDCDCYPARAECLPPLPPGVEQPPIPPPRPFCCDCRRYPNAVAEKPDFWID